MYHAPSPLQAAAHELAFKIGRMDAAERQRMADAMPVVMNPSGHQLSPLNTILLCQQSQRTDLTIVAGFRQWIGAGRCVRKGEHAIGYIRVPIRIVPRGSRDGAGQPLPGKEDEKSLRFRFVAVFDVSQTDELAGSPSVSEQPESSEVTV